MLYLKQVKFRTPESVELEYTLAGIGNRVLALLVDYILWALTLALVMLLGTLFASEIIRVLGNIFGTEALELWLAATMLLAVFVVYVGYFTFFETIWRGQTPGKRIANIRVLKEDGSTVGLVQAMLRSLIRPIDDLLFIGFFLILFTPFEKRLGDFAAGTIVTQEIGDTAKRSAEIVFSPAADSAGDWLEQNTAIGALEPNDFVVLREFLQRRSQMTTAVKVDVALKLTEQLRGKVGLPDLPKGMTVETFVEGLFLAYQKQTER